MQEKEFVEKVRDAGGTPYIVGGFVRDSVRGAQPHDKDYMVTGLTERALTELFPDAQRVGRSFPVFLVDIDGVKSEVALARREEKCGTGYRGFTVDASATVTLEADLYRRDTTMNSMAFELPDLTLHDPFDGQRAILAREIVAVSEHFTEDPVRSLRAARQAAEFGFSIAPATYDYMRACREELAKEPTERIFSELRRALAAPKPSIFFRAMRAAGLLEVTFPELAMLIGKTQPVEFHPEGDAFEHTMLVVDMVAGQTESLLARFCGLVHDLGKGLTPKSMEPHHYGHELRGQDVLAAWNRRMTLPHDWLSAGRFVIAEHMRAPRLGKLPKRLDLLLAIDKSRLTVAEFNAVILADNHELPVYLTYAAEFIAELKKITGRDAPSRLVGPQIAEWIRARQLALLRGLIAAKRIF